jgi:predicted cupin superfamily sugar epimerase
MNPRASELINLLDLEPYPEGGYFRQVFRSSHLVHLPDNQEERRALTTIYYLLVAGEHETWHRVSSDEVWHYHEGATLELYWTEPGAEECTRCLLGEVGGVNSPVAVVPGGCWQMARTTGEYTLVGCTVGPGFEYEDYTLLRDLPELASEIRRRFPELAEFVYASK